ncbi:MAG: serine/threonine protein kinase [Alphaproteobacteria bacterium]|nr:serine/threonine protein kinase [Alphaproteobacteria bacterium]
MTNTPQSLNEPDPLLGKTLAGRYLVLELIDRGGMGKVYRAEQQPLGRMVALKTLDLLDPRGEFRERFFNEASVASKLTHPNTVRIFDYGRSDEGVYFLTMELLEGESLHSLVKKEAPLAPLRLIQIARQVCGALHEAHERGIVHRDLKPGNVFLTRHGDDLEVAKVLDFGLVKDLDSDVNLSQTGQALGSPLYMSPEQVEGDPVDRRSDIYAMGLVMYVALTGRVPFKKGSVATIMMQQVTGTVPSFDEILPGHGIPFSLEWVVRRCIEKRPEHRIATMRELSRALKICAQEIRGELAEPVEWKLGPDGMLDLQAGLVPGQEDTNIPPALVPSEPSVVEVQNVRDIPSSPTLNASSINASRTLTAGAAVGVGVGGLVVAGGALVLVALVMLVAIGMFAMSPGTPAAPQPAPVVSVPAPVEPTRPEDREVRLESTPEGAEVLRGGRLLGVTPLVVKVAPGEEIGLTLQLEGHEARDVLVDGTVDELKVPMKAKAGKVVPATAPRVVPTRSPGAPEIVPDRGEEPGSPNMTEIRDPWEDG